MSSPFQLKFIAKNPVKGFTMAELERSTRRAEEEMKKNAAILPQIEGPGNPDYEFNDDQGYAGDDTYTYKKPEDSPLNAYVSTAGHFQRLQDNIARAFTPAKGSKTKADKEAEFKGETKKVSKKLKETTDTGFKDYNAKAEFDSKSGSVFDKDENNYFNRFGQ
tara:strand:+ start:125 stop:613 length:489 start_codon:yes stop_codon:yes gene_type:complete